MLEEFKKFAMRGNVVDLAVGVIIGAAFGAIVNSLVGDIIMPIIGSVTGGLDFSNYFIPLSSKVTASESCRRQKARCGAGLGQFPHHCVINFPDHRLRAVPGGQGHQPADEVPKRASAAPPAPSKEVQLLTEIRDVLKSRLSGIEHSLAISAGGKGLKAESSASSPTTARRASIISSTRPSRPASR